MDNHKIAKDWYQKAINNTDVFEKFICLWISFNAIYGKYSAYSEFKNDENTPKEKAQIKNCILHILLNSENRYQSLLESQEFLYFSNNVIHDCRPGSNSNTQKNMSIMKSNSVELSIKIVNLFFCIYQARCNLFHGDKTPYEYHDTEIITNASNILEMFLKIYFEEKENVTTD